MPLILVTNDDGIKSPGLRAAVEAVLPLGEVVVVAPSNQQTCAGRSFRGDDGESLNPVTIKIGESNVKGYHCHCSPAQIILHAFDVLFGGKKPDLLVSGINYGENLGTNVTISGTVGAAIQAASQGVPSLAVSLQTKMEDHCRYPELEWGSTRHFTHLFAKILLEKDMPFDVDMLNINVPISATAATAWKLSRLSRHAYFSSRVRNPTPSSKIGDGECTHGFEAANLEPDSDIHAFLHGQVSVSPMSIDLTSRVDLESDQLWNRPRFCS